MQEGYRHGYSGPLGLGPIVCQTAVPVDALMRVWQVCHCTRSVVSGRVSLQSLEYGQAAWTSDLRPQHSVDDKDYRT